MAQALLHAVAVLSAYFPRAQNGMGSGRKGMAMAEATEAKAKRTAMLRLVTLLLALLGTVVVAVPMAFPLAAPLPIMLFGCGMTTFALALFLFVSI